MNAATLEKARAAKAHAAEVFQPLAEVVGVGITRVESGYGLKINVANPPAEDVTLPGEVDGVPVRIEVVGRIRKRTA